MPLVPFGLTWERVWTLPWVAAAVPSTPMAELSSAVAPTPTLEADVPPALALPALPPVAPAWVWLPVAVELAVGGAWVWAAAAAPARAAATIPVCIRCFMILLLCWFQRCATCRRRWTVRCGRLWLVATVAVRGAAITT